MLLTIPLSLGVQPHLLLSQWILVAVAADALFPSLQISSNPSQETCFHSSASVYLTEVSLSPSSEIQPTWRAGGSVLPALCSTCGAFWGLQISNLPTEPHFLILRLS